MLEQDVIAYFKRKGIYGDRVVYRGYSTRETGDVTITGQDVIPEVEIEESRGKVICPDDTIHKLAEGRLKISDLEGNEGLVILQMLFGTDSELIDFPFGLKFSVPFEGEGLVRLIDKSLQDELIKYDPEGILSLTGRGENLVIDGYSYNYRYVKSLAILAFLRTQRNELEQKKYVGNPAALLLLYLYRDKKNKLNKFFETALANDILASELFIVSGVNVMRNALVMVPDLVSYEKRGNEIYLVNHDKKTHKLIQGTPKGGNYKWSQPWMKLTYTS